MGVEPKIGRKPPKMDGLFHRKPYFLMDDLGGSFTPYFWLETPKSILPNHPIRIFTPWCLAPLL